MVQAQSIPVNVTPPQPSEHSLGELLLEKASAFDTLHAGLLNALAEQGYFFRPTGPGTAGNYNTGRYWVRDPKGQHLHPRGGFCSVEEALTAIFADMKACAAEGAAHE